MYYFFCFLGGVITTLVLVFIIASRYEHGWSPYQEMRSRHLDDNTKTIGAAS